MDVLKFYWVKYHRAESPERMEVFGTESRNIMDQFVRESKRKGYSVGTVNVKQERKSA